MSLVLHRPKPPAIRTPKVRTGRTRSSARGALPAPRVGLVARLLAVREVRSDPQGPRPVGKIRISRGVIERID